MLPNTDRPRLPPGARPDEEASIWSYANLLLRRRRLLIVLAVAGAIGGLAYSVFWPREFTARASFAPVESGSRSSMAGIAGLAAQLGVAQLGALGASSTGSAQFYADLLRARELSLVTIRTSYSVTGPSAFDGTLIKYFALDHLDSVRAEVKALKKLDKVVSVSFDRLTSIVHVDVTMKNPQLAALVARRLLDLTNEFNLTRRKAQYSAEREFVEQQSSEAAATLRQAEDALSAFQAGNRNMASPLLAAELRRRERAMDIARQVYTTLMQQQAMTRMEAVRNTPVIAIIDNPESLVEPERRLHWAYTLAGLITGLLVVFVIAMLAESVEKARAQHADEYEEFRRLRRLR